MIARSNVPEEVKASLNLFKLIFYLVLFMHLVCCGWHMCCKIHMNKLSEDGISLQWYTPTNWLNYPDQILFEQEKTPLLEKYLTFFYHAVLVQGTNELGPVNKIEIAFGFMALFSAQLLNAQIFSEMALLLHTMGKKQTNYQEKLDNANEVMSVAQIPYEL